LVAVDSLPLLGALRQVRRGLLLAAMAVVASLGSSLAWAQPQATTAPRVAAGVYRLQGVREMAAELELKPQGRFEFAAAYGGVDSAAEGRWEQRGRQLVLTTDPRPPAALFLGSYSPDLLGDYGNEPDKPTLLVVRVSTPRMGLTWSNMQITAEFSNGLTRQGVTGRSGMLGFLRDDTPKWKGHTVRRVSVAYPKGDVAAQWFAVNPKTTRGVDVHFEPGHVMPAAFEQSTLEVMANGSQTLVVRSGAIARPGSTFVLR
jgi:hypothetical protein